MVVIPSYEMRLILAELIATGNELDAVELRMFSNDIVPTLDTVVGDLVESAFDGYAAVTPVVWNPPFTDVVGQTQVTGGCVQFTCTGITTPETAFGWYITQGAAMTLRLIAVERLETPVVMSSIGRAVIVTPRIPLTTW